MMAINKFKRMIGRKRVEKKKMILSPNSGYSSSSS
jgi:hypothetical protein